jgi:hypothetical protein
VGSTKDLKPANFICLSRIKSKNLIAIFYWLKLKQETR